MTNKEGKIGIEGTIDLHGLSERSRKQLQLFVSESYC